MRKVSYFIVLVLSFCLIAGCSANTRAPVSDPPKQPPIVDPLKQPPVSDSSKQPPIVDPIKQTEAPVLDNKPANYDSFAGDWSLKVSEDEELYLMTALVIYYGSTGINIEQISNGHMTGSIYSISGAPSYRQANVDFKGDIINGKLTAPYKDEGWLYSGKIELAFGMDEIKANITREKTESTPMWGIPEGQFTFLRSIETEEVQITDAEKAQLTKYLSAITKDKIKPFFEGDLIDEQIINFIALNLGTGTIDIGEFGEKIKSGAEIVFDESVMNDLSARYFARKIKVHQSTDIATFQSGTYSVPALGGISEYPVVQMLLKDTENKGRYYAIVDYMLETPAEPLHVEYQYLIKLQKGEDYTIKSIKEVKSPIEFELLRSLKN